MRIVQLANFYAPRSGGLRLAVDRWGAGYVAAGHVRLLIVPGRVDRLVETEAGERLEVASPTAPGGNYRVIIRHATVREALRRFAPDALEVSDQLTLGRYGHWAQEHGCGAVLFAHERAEVLLARRLVFVADLHHRRLARPFQRVVCASERAAQEWARAGVSAAVVPLGVDLEAFRPLSHRLDGPTVPRGASPHFRRAGVQQLICVSRLSREKHVDVAIGLLAVLRHRGVPAELTVVGAGPRLRALVDLARGLPVRFTGHVSDPSEISRLVGSADLFVAPGPFETFGLAALEALACGTPVIAPGASAVAELLSGSAGAVAGQAEPAAMADAALAALRHAPAVRRQAARAVAERYPWSASVDGLLSVLDQAVSTARLAHR